MIDLPPPANDTAIDDNWFLALLGHFDEPPAEFEFDWDYLEAVGVDVRYDRALADQTKTRQNRPRLIEDGALHDRL